MSIRARIRTLMVGGRIDGFRRGLGLTVEGWAKLCRVPQKTMESICMRRRDPSVKTFYCILRYGGMHLSAFSLEDFGKEGLV